VKSLRLYGYWRSSASYRVRIALELKGLSYDYLPVHLLAGGGQQFSPAYLALNPQARVPALETADGVLTQSMAIIEWLEETYPEPALLPHTASLRARVRALAQILVADVQPLQNQSVTAYLKGELRLEDAALKAWLRHWISKGLGAIEELLGQEPGSGEFCVGDTPTVADVCLVPQCASSRRFGMDPADYPRIARIERSCNAIAAFQRAAPARQPDAES
jgi:maleylacetoacetate isomerase